MDDNSSPELAIPLGRSANWPFPQDVAACFVRVDSVYKRLLPGRTYDIHKPAYLLPVGVKAIYHPPCRAWGNYAHLAKPRPGEKDLALWAMDRVRRFGGILEHPKTSRLWQYLMPGDNTVAINQCDFGHGALKPTLLFYNRLGAMPPLPSPRPPTNTVENMNVKEREETPVDLAEWLVSWLIA